MTKAQLKVVQKLYKALDGLISAELSTAVSERALDARIKKRMEAGIRALSASDATVWLTEADQKRTGTVRRQTRRRTTRRSP